MVLQKGFENSACQSRSNNQSRSESWRVYQSSKGSAMLEFWTSAYLVGVADDRLVTRRVMDRRQSHFLNKPRSVLHVGHSVYSLFYRHRQMLRSKACCFAVSEQRGVGAPVPEFNPDVPNIVRYSRDRSSGRVFDCIFPRGHHISISCPSAKAQICLLRL